MRIGNAAADQRQLDIYGELIDSVYLYNKYGSPIFSETWDNLRRIVDWLCENWDQADEGIWETRGGQKDFTYSRLMCWVALERSIRMNRARGLPGDIVRWLAERDRIYNQIMQKGWSEERGAFVQHYGSDVLDASLLLMPLTLFIAPSDPRWLSTLDAIGDELVSDSLVYRYNVEASPDGLRGDEGTFSICSFWYVEALTRAGRVDEARLAFEKMLTYANHLGLYSEEIGPTGEALGQLPAGVHPPGADQRRLQPRPGAGVSREMRVIECNHCGETISAASNDELTGRLATHLGEEHDSGLTFEELAGARRERGLRRGGLLARSYADANPVARLARRAAGWAARVLVPLARAGAHRSLELAADRRPWVRVGVALGPARDPPDDARGAERGGAHGAGARDPRRRRARRHRLELRARPEPGLGVQPARRAGARASASRAASAGSWRASSPAPSATRPTRAPPACTRPIWCTGAAPHRASSRCSGSNPRRR